MHVFLLCDLRDTQRKPSTLWLRCTAASCSLLCQLCCSHPPLDAVFAALSLTSLSPSLPLVLVAAPFIVVTPRPRHLYYNHQQRQQQRWWRQRWQGYHQQSSSFSICCYYCCHQFAPNVLKMKADAGINTLAPWLCVTVERAAGASRRRAEEKKREKKPASPPPRACSTLVSFTYC